MTFRSFAARASFAAAAALLALWVSAPARAADDTLSINIPEQEVDLGDRTVVRGRLFTRGEEAGRRVFLLGRKFPYKRERIFASTYTGTGGTYWFRVRPTLNTRYRVRYDNLHSDVRRVWVFPTKKKTWVSDSEGVARAGFFQVFPPDYPLPLSNRLVTWYFRKSSSNVYRAIATSRSRGARRPRRMTGRVSFDLPRSSEPYSYFVTWCFKLGREGQDIGIGRNAGGGCPRRFRDD